MPALNWAHGTGLPESSLNTLRWICRPQVTQEADHSLEHYSC